MLTISRTALLSALDVCLTATSGSSAASILEHVLVCPGDGSTTFHATDYDVRVVAKVPSRGVQPPMAIHGKTLSDAVRNVTSDEVTLTRLDNGWVMMTAGTSTFRLAGLPPDDYPESQKLTGGVEFTIRGSVLADLIATVRGQTSTDETRPSLNGAMLRVEREEGEVRLTMVATDGHRLGKCEFLGGALVAWPKTEGDVIIGNKALASLAKSLASVSDNVTVRIVSDNFVVEFADRVIASRVIDESFPDYRKVIPRTFALKATLDKGGLEGALKAVAPMMAAKTQLAKLTFDGGTLTLHTQSPERGEATATVTYEGEALAVAVGVNVKYLLQALATLGGDTVWIGATDQFSPLSLTSPGDDGTLHIIMPMRI